jgi:hypothetical protein
MDLYAEVLKRLLHGKPFRVAVPLAELTAFLSKLSEHQAVLPAIAVRRAEPAGDALLDFAGRDNSWSLRSSAEPAAAAKRSIRPDRKDTARQNGTTGSRSGQLAILGQEVARPNNPAKKPNRPVA